MRLASLFFFIVFFAVSTFCISLGFHLFGGRSVVQLVIGDDIEDSSPSIRFSEVPTERDAFMRSSQDYDRVACQVVVDGSVAGQKLEPVGWLQVANEWSSFLQLRANRDLAGGPFEGFQLALPEINYVNEASEELLLREIRGRASSIELDEFRTRTGKLCANILSM